MVFRSANERRMNMKKTLFTIVFLALACKDYGQTLGTNTQVPEGSCVAGTTTSDTLCANSADHTFTFSGNGASGLNISQTFYDTTTYTNATTSFTSVTGLSFPISASRNYHVTCNVFWQASAITSGPKYQFTGPSGFTALQSSLVSPLTQVTYITQTANTYNTALANTGTAIPILSNLVDIIQFSVINGSVAGTVQLQAAANGSGTLTIQPGSNCVVQ